MLVGALALLFTACQKDDTFEYDESLRGEVSFSSTIAPMTDALTRAAVNHTTDGKVSFANGDQISLFVTPENGTTTKYTATYNNNSWTINSGTLTWEQLNARTRFTAFWPAIKEAAGQEHEHNIKNQKWNNGVKDSDILVASVQAKGGDVALNFKHAVSLVQVEIKTGENISEGKITSGGVIIKACNGMKINTVTGEITPATGAVQEFSLNNGQGASTTFSALVCPQAIQADWYNNGWLKITIGSSAWYNAPRRFSSNNTEFNNLESGKVVKVVLTPGNKDVTAELDDIYRRTRWAYGIQKPMPISKWGYVDRATNLYGYSWTEGCGWYDCKKYNHDQRLSPHQSSVYPFDDGLMCWAATSSNMLHWWFDRNADYIARYNYTGPTSAYPDALHSEIFNHFKKAFANNGGWMKAACGWFISDYGRPTDVANDQIPRGFFKDVFTSDAINEILIEDYDATNVGNLLKQAYPENPNIDNSWTVGFATLKGSHAMTIWGAAFDDVTGEPTHVFMCDNNMRDWEFEASNPQDETNPAYLNKPINQYGVEVRAGMAMRRVRKNTANNNRWQIEMSNGWDDFWGITLLNSGRKYWEAYYNK